jgi:aryl carrier-like protein
MIPTQYIQLPTIPLTPNGKLDRTKLPTPTTPEPDKAEPASAIEVLVGEVVSDLLGLAAVGPSDNFFTVGGDSIRALKLVARLRGRGYEVGLLDVFRSRTIRELGRCLVARPAPPEQPRRPAAFSLISPADLARLHGREEQTVR